MQNLCEILKKTFLKFYSLSENLVVEKVIFLFKGRDIFLTIHTQGTQMFWHQNLQTV